MSRANDDEWNDLFTSICEKPMLIKQTHIPISDWSAALYKELDQLTHYGTPHVGLTVRLVDVERAIKTVAGEE
jgi:hypothetical protein